MPLRIHEADLHLVNLRTRMPFRYGIVTMTECPHAFVRILLEFGGKTATGIAADHLPPKWFTKDPARPIRDEVLEMAEVVDHAVRFASTITGDSPFEFWRQLYEAQLAFGKEKGLPPLLTNFGTSLVERAMLEAFCKIAEKRVYRLARANRLGVKLGELHASLKGTFPADYLPVRPRSRVIARHTVGLTDPLIEADIKPEDRVNDGLPQSLEAAVRTYGLKHLKIKVSGNLESDVARLRRIAEVMAVLEPDFQFSLDGNEQFQSLDAFREFWQRLTEDSSLAGFLQRLLFVEQPFHRDIALDATAIGALKAWQDRPTIIIDESDGDLESLPRALELGYAGTSHKNCKGVFKGLANSALIQQTAKNNPATKLILSGEDLANIGPVALLQDLAVCAMFGIQSVERNGHHYFAGLSMFPDEIQSQILDSHPDLYHVSKSGWPTLSIEKGALNLGSVNRASFGVGFEINVKSIPTYSAWKTGYESYSPPLTTGGQGG